MEEETALSRQRGWSQHSDHLKLAPHLQGKEVRASPAAEGWTLGGEQGEGKTRWRKKGSSCLGGERRCVVVP